MPLPRAGERPARRQAAVPGVGGEARRGEEGEAAQCCTSLRRIDNHGGWGGCPEPAAWLAHTG
eukprot:15196315-Alexandrium_andersonii.AAC.1